MPAPAPAPAPPPRAPKSVDRCLRDFQKCVSKAPGAPPAAQAPAARAPPPVQPPAAARAPPAAATTPTMSLRTYAAPVTATWVRAGYKPISSASTPAQFRLKNATTGQYIIAGPNNTIVEGAGTGLVITKATPGDIYKNTATTSVVMLRLDTPNGSIRHSNFVLMTSPYVANNYDFAWKPLLKNGTTDRIILWNPYPGNAAGMYLMGGSRPRIDPGTPTEYIIEPVTAGSGASGYTLEGSEFGGMVGPRRDWNLILILVIAVILLWIISKNL